MAVVCGSTGEVGRVGSLRARCGRRDIWRPWDDAKVARQVLATPGR